MIALRMFQILVQRDEVTVPFYVQPDTVRHTAGRPEMIDLKNTSLLAQKPKKQ